MSHLYKMVEWQDGAGNFHCNDTSDLAGIAGYWWVPARMLDLTPAEFVEWLITNYHPDFTSFNGVTFLYWWKPENYGLMHKYLLYINAEARKRKFYV